MTLDEYSAFLDGNDEPVPREATLEEVMTLAASLSNKDKARLIQELAKQLIEE